MRISRRMTVVTEENAVLQYFYLLDARNAPSPSLKKRFAQLSIICCYNMLLINTTTRVVRRFVRV